MSGILYLVATPIGNLEDMTFRAVRILREVGLIAAEDTRNSIKLLNHFEIKTPMTSYHEHNKYEKADELVAKLLAGTDVAVITDAGTPGISDPGEELVKKSAEAGIRVVPVPGACAAVNALAASGLSTGRFAFEAFLPTDNKKRKMVLEEMKRETRTLIVYEAPHRLRKTLTELSEMLGDRAATVCRELTKRHEEFFRTTLFQASDYYAEHEPRGECVIVIEGLSRAVLAEEARKRWDALSVPEHLAMYMEQGMDKKNATKQVARDRGIPKREVYEFAKEM